MPNYASSFPDIPLSDLSITERVFEGLETRPSETVLIDGPSGRGITAIEFIAVSYTHLTLPTKA